jgi:TonB family protein
VLLPVAFFWQRGATAPSGDTIARIVGWRPEAAPTQPTWNDAMFAMVVCVAAIATLRLGWIGLGLLRLGVIRRRSHRLSPLPSFVQDLSNALRTSASIHLSSDVGSPVTIGFHRPLILLPERVVDQPFAVQRAIVCHELLHVKRHDWLRTVLEQVWRSLLWFHPAAHLLLSHVGLMREAVVDAETIRLTGDRRAYAQALLDFADPAPLSPLLVAPLIKPRHLPRRIALIAQEVRMSPNRSAAALTVALVVAALATGATAQRLPLALSFSSSASPTAEHLEQEVFRPGDGVSLPRVIKEVKPEYTAAAMQEKIQGSVRLDTVIAVSGEPTNIRVTQSLDDRFGLDQAAVDALSQWRFEPGRKDGKAVPVLVEIEIRFTLK